MTNTQNKVMSPPTYKQTEARPTVEIISVSNGFGYTIRFDNTSIMQDHAPAINGYHFMSESEATNLGNYIADKIHAGLTWSVSSEQVTAIFSGTKTSQQLMDEEMAFNLNKYNEYVASQAKNA